MLINLTPEEFRCPPLPGCSAVFMKKELNELVYLVGKKVERVGEFSEIPVSEDEELIAMPLGLLRAVKFPKVEV